MRCAVYRLNTYPFIHLNFFHALMNVLALVPLLERFESEHGTLTSLALFFGRELLDLCLVEEVVLTGGSFRYDTVVYVPVCREGRAEGEYSGHGSKVG